MVPQRVIGANTPGSRTSKLYTIRNLTGGTQYSVRGARYGRRHRRSGPGASPKVTKRPIAATPAQVTMVEVAPSTTALVVTWKKTDGVTGYKVEWMSASGRREHDVAVGDLTDADSPSLSIIPTGATGHPALMPGIQYTVRVQAVNEHATTPGGAWSTGVPSMLQPALVTLKDQDSETANDQFVIPGANSLKVAWNEAAGAHSYKVQWKSGTLDYHSSRQKVWTDLMKLEYEIPDLEPGTEYTVQVIATNALGKDGDPSAATDNTGRPKPAKVTGVQVTAGLSQGQTAHELTVTWNTVPGADRPTRCSGSRPDSTTDVDASPTRNPLVADRRWLTGTSYTIAPTANTGPDRKHRVHGAGDRHGDGRPLTATPRTIPRIPATMSRA